MRPLVLTFSGLRSYRDTTSIDFSQLDLFAVIGDTGAGKSTIIEALSLALYAKKSWTGGPAGLSDMIADGLNTIRVELRFRADDHEWVVTRARHRNSSAPIDKLTSPTGGGPNVDGARPVTDRVTELVGLDHDQFTRAVVLPQGRFDLLLRATEKQRTEILSSILGLGDIAATRAAAERVRDTWNERAIEVRTQRSHLPADPAGELAAATAHAAAADARVDVLTAARDAAVLLHRRAGEQQAELARVTTALRRRARVDGRPRRRAPGRPRSRRRAARRPLSGGGRGSRRRRDARRDTGPRRDGAGRLHEPRPDGGRRRRAPRAEPIGRQGPRRRRVARARARRPRRDAPGDRGRRRPRACRWGGPRAGRRGDRASWPPPNRRRAWPRMRGRRSRRHVRRGPTAQDAVAAASGPVGATAAALEAAETALAVGERGLADAVQAEREALVAGAVAAVCGRLLGRRRLPGVRP